jgi:heptosyltransferase II
MQSNSATRSNRDALVRRATSLADRMTRPVGEPVQPHPASIERIVVIKPCCLGDMLMATPAIRALSQHFPDAEITIITNNWTRPAIDTNPRISRLILYPDTGAFRTAIQMGYRLREFKFDLGVSLDRSPITALILRLAGVPVRVGIDSDSRGIGLSHRVSPEPNQHETDLYLSAIRTLGISDTSPEPEFVIPDEAIQSVDRLMPRRTGSPLVVIHPGGAVNPGVTMLEKRWPATNFGELAALLIREIGASIVLVGTETDRNAVATVRDFARAPVLDLCGELTIAQLAALCRQASLFVGNDSGVSHLASAVGTPVVAIFGPTNPDRYRPLGRRTLVCAPPSSRTVPDLADLRYLQGAELPDIATVPLPQVLNACLELLGGTR